MSTPFYDLASLVVVPSGYKASKVYAQKPQTTDGQLALTRSTTATRVNSAGLIEASAINVPRLDYTNSTCPKLLLEPQRANLYLYSNDFSDANWAKADSSVTASAIISPDGTVNAWKLNDTTANAQHALLRSVGGITSPSAISFFVKSAEYSKCCIENYSDGGRVVFNIANKTIVSTSANFTSATIQQYANGFIRISATTVGTTGNKAIGIGLVNDLGQDSFIGTGTKGIYVYGAQLEAGAYATSYIPTTTAAVTRAADECSKTGISSLIGQTEGVLFAEIDLKNAPITGSYLMVRNAAVTNYLSINWRNDIVRFETVNGGVIQTAINFAVSTPQILKVAVAYKVNDFVMYVNGTQVGTDTSATVPTCDILDLNFNGPSANAFGIAQTLIFKTRLTNAQLAELTTI